MDKVTAQSTDIEKTLESETTPPHLEPVNNQKQTQSLYRTAENTPRDYKIYGIINEAK